MFFIILHGWGYSVTGAIATQIISLCYCIHCNNNYVYDVCYRRKTYDSLIHNNDMLIHFVLYMF